MGGIVDGLFGGGNAAEDAANVQAEASGEAIAEQRRQFDITQEQFAPFREAGLSALGQQLAFLGLPQIHGVFEGEEIPDFIPRPAPQLQGFDRGFGGAFGNVPGFGTNFAPQGTFDDGFAAHQERVAGIRERNRLGQEQFDARAGAETASPTGFGSAFDQFTQSPGQQFLRKQQERSLLRNASATGSLGGGNIKTALQEQAFGRGATQLGDFQNRLAGISGTGQAVTSQLGQLGAQNSSNISNLLQSAGESRASGILGAQQANSGLANGLLSAGVALFSDERLKENIIKVGELDSGLGWYTWSWSKEGRKLAGDQPDEGVLASEVKKLIPDAVVEVDGYAKVYYERIH